MWNPLEYLAILLTVTAGFAYANHYVLRLPRNSGLLVVALIASLCVRLVEDVFPSVGLGGLLRQDLERANLGPLLLNGFLGFLLFAAALHVDVRELFARKWTILALATAGVALSTFAMAAGVFYVFRLVGFDVPLLYCLVFGALISPTDPVTILDVLERSGVPTRLRAIIAGESLFNDGAGIVLYTIFAFQATQGGAPELSALDMVLEFLTEAGGGALLGLATGGVALMAMRGIQEHNVELLISLALATGTYALALSLGVSGPVAVVVAGLLMGSVGVKYVARGSSRDYLQRFWSLTDQLLNAVLFMLIGLELAVIDLRWTYVAAAALAIPLSLAVRGFSITAASLPLNLGAQHKLSGIALLTWSGLRGGVAIALALSLPPSSYRDALITACYGVAVFTMVVQGLSLGRVASRLYPPVDP